MSELSIDVYNIKGEKTGTIELPSKIFAVEINHNLVHQAITAQLANRYYPWAHTKDRSEVKGGGRKPWRQKGTGRARHGSIRSPLWVGGGITFGPRKERVFKKKINKKMKRKALFMVLTSKVKDKELILIDSLELKEPKTKLLVEILKNLLKKVVKKKDFKNDKNLKVLLVLPKKDDKLIKASRNIPKTKTILADSLNVLDLLSYKYLFMPKEAIGVIKQTYLGKK